jgi:hypothetical protein
MLNTCHHHAPPAEKQPAQLLPQPRLPTPLVRGAKVQPVQNPDQEIQALTTPDLAPRPSWTTQSFRASKLSTAAGSTIAPDSRTAQRLSLWPHHRRADGLVVFSEIYYIAAAGLYRRQAGLKRRTKNAIKTPTTFFVTVGD